MKKEKRLYTRRGRALRAAALALALLLFCNGVLHIGFLLPSQAFRCAERRQGVYEREKIVARRWEPGMMHATDRLFLAEGKNSLTLGCTYLTPYGWDPSFVWALDASEGGDVQAGVIAMGRGDKSALVFFGRIEGTDVEYLNANVRVDDVENSHVYYYGHEIGNTERVVRNGCTYYICVAPEPVPEELSRLPRSYVLVVNRPDGSSDHAFELTAGVSWG